MKRNYLPGERIELVLMTRDARRLACVGIATGKSDEHGPQVRVTHPQIATTTGWLEIDLVAELIEPSEPVHRYRGEIRGAVLVPDDFLR